MLKNKVQLLDVIIVFESEANYLLNSPRTVNI